MALPYLFPSSTPDTTKRGSCCRDACTTDHCACATNCTRAFPARAWGEGDLSRYRGCAAANRPEDDSTASESGAGHLQQASATGSYGYRADGYCRGRQINPGCPDLSLRGGAAPRGQWHFYGRVPLAQRRFFGHHG